MLLQRFTISILMLLGFSSTQAAELAAPAPNICFHDVREFEAVRDRLPVQLRSGSVHAIHKSFGMKGGFRVFQAGSRFVLEGKGKAILLGRIDESANIKVACVQGTKISVWLDDGRYDEITIDPKGFRFHDYLFKVTTPEIYARTVR